MGDVPHIVTYYNQTHLGYRLFWRLDSTLSMHYGLRDESHRSHVASVLNLIRILAELGEISPADEVLDVGCGFGGSSLWLAENIGCRVTGIDINPKEIAAARRSARARNLDDRVRFLEMDYREMDAQLEPESFSVVWQVETLIYADRRRFALDAARRLRPGGRLVVADYFARPGAYAADESAMLERWVRGWAGRDLITADDFLAHLAEAGLADLRFFDRSAEALPSSRRMARVCRLTTPLGRFLEIFGLRSPLQTENSLGAVLQYEALRRGLWIYGLVGARKPGAT